MSESISLTSFITGTESSDLQATDASNATQETNGNNNGRGNRGNNGRVDRGNNGRGGRGSGAAVIVDFSQGAGNRLGQALRGADDAAQTPNQPIAEPQTRQELNTNLNAAVNAVTATFAGTPDGGNGADAGGVVTVPVGLDAIAPPAGNDGPTFQVGSAPPAAPTILADDDGPTGGGVQLAASFQNTALGGPSAPSIGNQVTPEFSILDNNDDGGPGNRIEPAVQGPLARVQGGDENPAPQFGPAARAAAGLGPADAQPQNGLSPAGGLGGDFAIDAAEDDNGISILDDDEPALSRAADPDALTGVQNDPNASPGEAIAAAVAGPDTGIANARDIIPSAEVASPAEALAAREPAGANDNAPPSGALAPAVAQALPSITDEVEEDPNALALAATDEDTEPAAPPPGIATEPAADENTGGPAVPLPDQAALPEPAETAAGIETDTAPAEPVVIPEPAAADEPATAPVADDLAAAPAEPVVIPEPAAADEPATASEANELAAAPVPPAPIAGAGPAPAAPEPGPAPADVEPGRPNLTTTPGQEALEADAQLAFEAQQQNSRTSEPATGSVIDLFIR